MRSIRACCSITAPVLGLHGAMRVPWTWGEKRKLQINICNPALDGRRIAARRALRISNANTSQAQR